MAIDYKNRYERLLKKYSKQQKENEEFKNGNAYVKVKEENKKLKQKCWTIEELAEKKYLKLQKELEHTITRYERKIDTYYPQIFSKDDAKLCSYSTNKTCLYINKIKKEHEAKIKEKDKIIEDLRSKLQKAKASNNKDFTNSSIPSSGKSTNKKIPNSRVHTDRKVGGQKEHVGHKRKRLNPTESDIEVEVEKKFKDKNKYKETDKFKTKDIVDIEIKVVVQRYKSQIFKEIKTGKERWSKFPANIINETNYGNNLKTFMFILNNYTNVALNKISELISSLTNNKINISEATIHNYLKEFSKKGKESIENIETALSKKDVLGIDFTNSKCNGENKQVFVVNSDDLIKYYARNKKGHDGIKNTIIELYTGTLVRDHDKTFDKYGTRYQECLAHIIRYLKGTIENEPNLWWPRLMSAILKKAIKENNLNDNLNLTQEEINVFNNLYDVTIKVAEKEYKENPPNKYNREGYNLYKRLSKTRDNLLLFLTDKNIPPTNNFSERSLRKIKRKLKQMTTFRSMKSFEYYCDALTLLSTWSEQNKNIFEVTKNIFAKHTI